MPLDFYIFLLSFDVVKSFHGFALNTVVRNVFLERLPSGPNRETFLMV